MPVDPYGGGYYDTVYEGQDISPVAPSWWDLISQGIHEGAQTAQVIGAGYPPGSTIVYSPQYPGGQVVPAQYPPMQTMPGVPGTVPAAAPGAGVQLSNTTLMLLVGGVLLFMLGTKRGR